jgi:hypothetical protein
MKSWAGYAIVILGLLAYQAMTDADRDDTGAIVSAGNVDAFEIAVGDCFDDPTATDEIDSLPAVPCGEPHDNEVYAAFDVSLPAYPDDDVMFDHAIRACIGRFAGFVGRDYESSVLDIYTMYPTAESWQHDDREIVCAVYDLAGEKLVGSVRGRAL